MTKSPTRTTTRRSVTVAAEQTTLTEAIDALPGHRAYVIESHSFAARLEQDRRDRIVEITRLDTEMEDISARIGHLQAELDARADHRADVQNIVDQINAALAVGPRQIRPPAPRLTAREGASE